MLLEVCAYNIQSCLIAQAGGAGRIELCADPAQGGVTPSYGTIKQVLAKVSIPIYAMIRPRGGDFVYDADELAIMHEDIAMCKQLGCAGIAVGVLLPDNRIDVPAMQRIVELAYPMGVTCHKAFDRTTDATQALEDIIAAGCERVLTSGLMPTAMEGAATIRQLNEHAKGRITVMPGGSVRSSNINEIITATGSIQYHSSCITANSTEYIADRDEVVAITGRLSVVNH